MPAATKDSAEDVRLAQRLTQVAIDASAAILKVDFRDCGARLKADASPEIGRAHV